MKDVRIFKDGDKWCAVYEDFVNLQESPAGFSKTREGALYQLYNIVGMRHVKGTTLWKLPRTMYGANYLYERDGHGEACYISELRENENMDTFHPFLL